MLEVTFFGTAGSRAVPDIDRIKYGQSTTSIGIKSGPINLIFDAGSGIVNYGNSTLSKVGGSENYSRLDELSKTIHLFSTHYHGDHTEGFSQFPLAYHPETRLIIAGDVKLDERIERLQPYIDSEHVFRRNQSGIYFPVRIDHKSQLNPEENIMPAHIEFLRLKPENEIATFISEYEQDILLNPETFSNPNNQLSIESILRFRQIGDVKVTPIRLNHPQGSIGYIVEDNDSKIALIFDYEHGNEKIDEALYESIHGVDLAIWDTSFADDHIHKSDIGTGLSFGIREKITPAKYSDHVGWGHSTLYEAIRAADQSNIPTIIGTHHEPRHTDIVLDYLEQDAKNNPFGINVHLAVEGEIYRVKNRSVKCVGGINFKDRQDKLRKAIKDLQEMHGS